MAIYVHNARIKKESERKHVAYTVPLPKLIHVIRQLYQIISRRQKIITTSE